ncbi:SDR family oxidoreductase [Pseudomonas sp. UBA6323]|uniref:SDR family oxidoreductase n=1 Tax=Pseudomonas sp. UBA6323 TaxID=1947329 RepID=UPI0025EA072B|nr:SDR family oxidoreductase [Pseudomonas sp. UBA6323]
MTKARLNDALVVITGASSGIGRCAAHEFARHGARLVLAARDDEALACVVDECQRLGARALAVPTDVTRNEAMENLAEQAAAFGNGRIDIWVNNAGVGAVGCVEDTPLAAHEQVVQTDLLGYLRGAYVVMPYFKAQSSGVLINTLSLGSWVAQPYAAAYSAAKYGLRGLTEALRGELVQWPDIHVCDIYPAVMDTPGFRDGGNFTGHQLSPPPPRYDPRRVAEAMVEMAQAPRATRTVGSAATLLRLGHFLLPGFAQISGLVVGRALKRGQPTQRSTGNLFQPPSGERRIDGGWRTPAEGVRRPVVLVGTAAIVLLGWGLLRLRNGSR